MRYKTKKNKLILKAWNLLKTSKDKKYEKNTILMA